MKRFDHKIPNLGKDKPLRMLKVRTIVNEKRIGMVIFKNIHFKCELGKAGIGLKKREGDNITPIGKWGINTLFFRRDKLCRPRSQIKTKQIKRTDGWCDDKKSFHYNKKVLLPFKGSHEKLYRKDGVYDIFLELDFNIHPRTIGKGSAIFMHFSNSKCSATAGCIALSKKSFLRLLSFLTPQTKLWIKR